MSVNVTYGLTAGILNGYIAQLNVDGANNTMTPAAIADQIESAAAELNGVLRQKGVDIEAVDLDVDSLEFKNCQRAVAFLARPELLFSYFDMEVVGAAYKEARAQALAVLEDVKANPTKFGLVPAADEGLAPRVVTSTQSRNIDTSERAQNERFRFRQGRTSRPINKRW